MLGEITLEEKVSLLRRAKAVLFPIDWPEPFGLVMTEAMACGTPVIATPRGSVPEVVEDGVTGWIVDVEDYPAQAAERLRGSPRSIRTRAATACSACSPRRPWSRGTRRRSSSRVRPLTPLGPSEPRRTGRRRQAA